MIKGSNKNSHLYSHVERKMKQKIMVGSLILFGIACCFFASEMVRLATVTSHNIPIVPTIIIDAGHGGFDGGAVSADGICEKDINLSIAQKLDYLLTIQGFDVIMIREEDCGLDPVKDKNIRQRKIDDMNARLHILKNNPDALLISIHQNKFPSAQPKGAQVFYNYKSQESKELATLLQTHLKNNLDSGNHRLAKESGSEYFLLDNTPTVGVIVECGFLSNPEDLNKITDNDYQNRIAFTILSALQEYINQEG